MQGRRSQQWDLLSLGHTGVSGVTGDAWAQCLPWGACCLFACCTYTCLGQYSCGVIVFVCITRTLSKPVIEMQNLCWLWHHTFTQANTLCCCLSHLVSKELQNTSTRKKRKFVAALSGSPKFWPFCSWNHGDHQHRDTERTSPAGTRQKGGRPLKLNISLATLSSCWLTLSQCRSVFFFLSVRGQDLDASVVYSPWCKNNSGQSVVTAAMYCTEPAKTQIALQLKLVLVFGNVAWQSVPSTSSRTWINSTVRSCFMELLQK